MARKWTRALAALGVAVAIAVVVPGVASAGSPTKPVNATTRVKMLNEDMCLTAFDATVGSQPGKYLCSTTDEGQVWEFIGPYDLEHGGAYYLMRNKKSQLCLSPGGDVPGSAVRQATCDEAANAQHWGITSGDFQTISSRASAHNLDITLQPKPKLFSAAYLDKFAGNCNSQCFTFPEQRPTPGP
jgi:hypothetical protein